MERDKREMDCWATTRSKWTQSPAAQRGLSVVLILLFAWSTREPEKWEAERTTLLAAVAAANCTPALGGTSGRWVHGSRNAAAPSLYL